MLKKTQPDRIEFGEHGVFNGEHIYVPVDAKNPLFTGFQYRFYSG
jgi:hypothetical protein